MVSGMQTMIKEMGGIDGEQTAGISQSRVNETTFRDDVSQTSKSSIDIQVDKKLLENKGEVVDDKGARYKG